MIGWSLGFFLAAIVAAFFGFGGVASTFAGLAVILFWVFIALFLLSLVFSLFGARVPVEGAPLGSRWGGTGIGALVVVAAVAILAYAWVKNDWNARDVGAALDRTAERVTADAGEAVDHANNRVEKLVNNTSDDLRHPDSDDDKNN